MAQPDPRTAAQPAPPRRTKAESLAMAASLKRQLLIGSIVGFGVFAALTAGQAASAASQSAGGASQGTPDDGAQTTGGYFDQQGGSSFGSGTSGGRHAVSGSGVS